MRILVYCLLALVIAVLIGTFAGDDSGYLVLRLSGWTIQTSATLFVISIFLFFLALYFIIRTLVRFIETPQEIKKWRIHRHQRRAEKYLTLGLINMTEGKWHKAERDFKRAAPYSSEPYVNYMLAARAAQEQGAIERRDDYLKLAYHNNPDAKLAIGITQAELQLDQKQTEQALATLKHLQQSEPQQGQVKQLLLNTYQNLEDWQSVLKTIPALEKTSLLSREQIEAKQLEAYAGLLKKAGQLEQRDKLDEVWLSIPRKLKQHFYLIEVYVSERLRFDNTEDCEELLRSALKKQWDTILIRLYGLVSAKDLNKQLQIAESYLNNHARDAVLLLSVGRICMRNQLWGKAKDYLKESIDVKPNPEAYYELAKIHEHEGNDHLAAECYEKGLELATKPIA
ncbi:MAG: heme biosynthesis protein HemY [Pseudomonadota bacterium]